MPLSPRFTKLLDSHRAELEHLRSTLASRTDPHDAIDLDHDLGVVTFRYRGRDLWQGHAILLGRLHLSAESFEWFADAVAQVPANVRAATPEFSEMQLPVISEADAAVLSDMVAHFRKAAGVLRRHEGPYISFYALHPFDDSQASASSAARQVEWTVPPPAVESLPPQRIITPTAPIRRSDAGRDHRSEPPEPVLRRVSSPPPLSAGAAGRAIRQPDRELLTPLAQLAVKAVDRALPGGFGQVLMTLVVDNHEGKIGIAMNIVASDRRGDLVSVDNPSGLFDLVASLLRADALSGNGRWGKLILRVRAHPAKLVMGVEVRS